MSKQLTKEAERYIEDFISNVEDTDISSLDGDRSDTNSSIRGITKTPNFQSPAVFKSVPVEMDGVMLPWLQWETSNDASPSLFENKPDLSQEAPSIQDLSNQFSSSNGSWSLAFSDCPSVSIGEDRGTKFGEQGRYHNQTQSSSIGAKTTQFDVNDYLNTKGNEAFLHEIWCQRRRISSGGLLLCNHIMF
ncbi:Nodulation receptor kinase [Gossypium australe]|uniref:Nodulation receptor kinase n=1 Tax=Gossypium australe TaxID=47621 RepID=A0A5B6W3E3_9ROSI|nr:Nodulation receptor kinase [Gossypium australe]